MDTQLINGCMDNDRAAQKAVYKALFDQMYRVCYRFLDNQQDVEEVVNQGFLKVFVNIRSYRGSGAFEGWVRRIMVRQALDFLKSQRKYKETQSQSYDGNEVAASVPNDAFANLGMHELLALVHELPPMTRAVFNLFAMEGYPHKDIATELGITANTSRWHLNAARKQLQQALLAQKTMEK